MSKSSRAIEQLARDICWAGFIGNSHKAAGCSKAAYWDKVSMLSKIGYRTEAETMLRLVRKLGIPRIQAALSATERKT